ncbi:MAG: hypothetical protein HGB17_00145 [Syntrophobacteraceae bacterium]|nr:hypothetical protein [Syntrophobacteraceae bacterium]
MKKRRNCPNGWVVRGGDTISRRDLKNYIGPLRRLNQSSSDMSAGTRTAARAFVIGAYLQLKRYRSIVITEKEARMLNGIHAYFLDKDSDDEYEASKRSKTQKPGN